MKSYKDIIRIIKQLADDKNISLEVMLVTICELLQKNIDHYDWVGFYFHDTLRPVLHLKTFAGDPTDHVEIPFGKGICGQVAVSNQSFLVEDVSQQDNYIACSFTVKSEIVVPLFVEGKNIGQIDIDSHVMDPFTEADERFLEFVNQEVGKLFL